MRSSAKLLLGVFLALPPAAVPVLSAAAEGGKVSARELLDSKLSLRETNPGKWAKALKEGGDRVGFCVRCHGKDGNSVAPAVPNLAGQNPQYLLEQIEKFADGRRQDYIMTPLARGFSAADKVAVALYFAGLTPRPRPADPELARKGEPRFLQVCRTCHGVDAHGGERYARLASQRPEYLKHRLFGFQGQTGGAVTPMTDIAKSLSDADVESLVAYLSSLP